MAQPLTATHAAWLGIPAYVLAADLWLLRHGQPSMSALARRHPAVTFPALAALGVHLARAWRFDPLHAFGCAVAKEHP